MLFRRTFSSAVRRTTDSNQNADFFRFTRGRFVANEAEEMAQRYVKFEMNELCRIAGQAVGKECVDVEKCPDGLYSKAFLLTMKGGQQVVAKVPNPNAGLPHFTTASEVATMDFMRTVTGTPVPRVLAWSSTDKNAVEAEYIVMEKAEGVQLGKVWSKLEIEQKVKVIRAIAKYQLAWSRVPFERIGSLYYKNDLPPRHTHEPLDTEQQSGNPGPPSRFTVGPILGRDWVEHGRADLACDRGPWPSAEAYKRAEIQRDMHAARTVHKLPKPLSMLCGPGMYQPTRDKKLRAGELALQVLSHALPREAWASSFYLWHDDLHEENIFVKEDNPAEITAIIDWQSTTVAPFFDHTLTPGLLEYEGPRALGLERPKLEPSTGASDGERSAAWKVYVDQTLAIGYKRMLKNSLPAACDALLWQESDDSHVNSACRSLLENSEAYCLASLADLEDSPVRFSEAERTAIQRDIEDTHWGIHCMEVIKGGMGGLFPEKGLVRHDQYEDAKAELRRIKAQVIDDFSQSDEDRRAWEEAWPFDD